MARRRNPNDDRTFYAGIYTPAGKLIEAFQSTRTQALGAASRRAHSGEVVKLFRFPARADCLKLVESFVKE
jgi:hypothetical protein